jgi:hypothetical protein
MITVLKPEGRLVIDIAAMAYSDNQDREFSLGNLVDNTVLPNPETPQARELPLQHPACKRFC